MDGPSLCQHLDDDLFLRLVHFKDVQTFFYFVPDIGKSDSSKEHFLFFFHFKNMEFEEVSLFQRLPLEVVSHIVSFLPSVKDINTFGQTCSSYHQLIREQDMRFVRKEYGTLPRPSKGITTKGKFHISPMGVLHGPCCTFFRGSATVSTYSHGVLSGFQMSVFENGNVESGTYRNGERVGLWKNDSEGFRKAWKGSSRRVMYNEDGSSYSHSNGGGTSDKIFSYDKDAKILAMYKAEMTDQDFRCEKTGEMFCAGYISCLPLTEGAFSGTREHFFHCCKEHQGDMPNDLLYFERPDGFLTEEMDK